MHAHILPAMQGVRWLSDSFKIYGKAQLRLPLIVLSYLALIFAFIWLGWVGIFLIFLCDPIFSVSLSNLSRAVERGKTVDPGIVFSGFSSRFKTLLSMGAIYAGVVAAAVMLSGQLFSLVYGGDQLQKIASQFSVIKSDAKRINENPKAMNPGDAKQINEEFKAMVESTQNEPRQTDEEFKAMIEAMTVLFLLTVLLRIPPSIVFWHAATLVAWHGMPKGKALFFGLVGCVRNWRAFLTYLVVFFVAVVLLPNLFLKLLARFGLEMKALLALSFVLIVLNMTFWFIGLYVSYRDIFAEADEPA
ncbi:MAG: hypothetical protein LBD67_04815 [Candidatus Accumulibacter sp.]|jgi:hypothetical protein|nr:hypothetical protein [Accumulibacter sp.]